MLRHDRHVTSNNQQNKRSTSANASILKGSYTQIMVNPMQLSEHEFMDWMEKLMEAQKKQTRKEVTSILQL